MAAVLLRMVRLPRSAFRLVDLVSDRDMLAGTCVISDTRVCGKGRFGASTFYVLLQAAAVSLLLVAGFTQ